MAVSDRQSILAEIKRLEAMKAQHPHNTHSINAQITVLCDRLKRPSEFKPRKVA